MPNYLNAPIWLLNLNKTDSIFFPASCGGQLCLLFVFSLDFIASSCSLMPWITQIHNTCSVLMLSWGFSLTRVTHGGFRSALNQSRTRGLCLCWWRRFSLSLLAVCQRAPPNSRDLSTATRSVKYILKYILNTIIIFSYLLVLTTSPPVLWCW